MNDKMTGFQGRILMLGCGSVAQCTLPLLLRHIDVSADRVTVMDFEDRRTRISDCLESGVRYVQERITQSNFREMLGKYVGPGDLIVDLAWDTETIEILEWCNQNNVMFINTSVEKWDPHTGIEEKSPYRRTLYCRQMRLRELKGAIEEKGGGGATAVVDHGANPGLVSHFVKRALLEIGSEMVDKGLGPASGSGSDRLEDVLAGAKRAEPGSFASLCQHTGTKVIHISERDTQISDKPKEVGEFVNTWSIEGFIEEGTAPAELGWGTHERRMPRYAYHPKGGPGNQIFIAQPGIRTFVYSWVPEGGQIIGMVVRHAEAFTISDYLTVWEDTDTAIRQPVFRPTVHYAYMPCDQAIVSLHEFAMHGYVPQERGRIMTDEITGGIDELGVLLLGHGLGGWWTGSQLGIEEARRLVPGQNATTLQVAAAVLAGVVWMIRNPAEGIKVPDELPHDEILDIAYPYLGPCPSVRTDWTPLRDRSRLFDRWGKRVPGQDETWQFTSFLVD
ncbi:MAG: saccharopine dehydrogenase C-terminal domain-containing protein [Candidatus Eisenbacteria bacterium]